MLQVTITTAKSQARRKRSQAAFSDSLLSLGCATAGDTANGQHAKLQMRCLLLVANSGLVASAPIPFCWRISFPALVFMSSHIGAVAVVKRRGIGKVRADGDSSRLAWRAGLLLFAFAFGLLCMLPSFGLWLVSFPTSVSSRNGS